MGRVYGKGLGTCSSKNYLSIVLFNYILGNIRHIWSQNSICKSILSTTSTLESVSNVGLLQMIYGEWWLLPWGRIYFHTSPLLYFRTMSENIRHILLMKVFRLQPWNYTLGIVYGPSVDCMHGKCSVSKTNFSQLCIPQRDGSNWSPLTTSADILCKQQHYWGPPKTKLMHKVSKKLTTFIHMYFFQEFQSPSGWRVRSAQPVCVCVYVCIKDWNSRPNQDVGHIEDVFTYIRWLIHRNLANIY